MWHRFNGSYQDELELRIMVCDTHFYYGKLELNFVLFVFEYRLYRIDIRALFVAEYAKMNLKNYQKICLLK